MDLFRNSPRSQRERTRRWDRHPKFYELRDNLNRDANRTLHMIAVCRLRYCPRTQAYAARRTKEGKTKREIIRCLKRYIAREAYHALTADLADLSQPLSPRPRHVPAITCGAGCIGRHRRRLDP